MRNGVKEGSVVSVDKRRNKGCGVVSFDDLNAWW